MKSMFLSLLVLSQPAEAKKPLEGLGKMLKGGGNGYYSDADRQQVRDAVGELEARQPDQAEMSSTSGRDTKFLAFLQDVEDTSLSAQRSQTMQGGFGGTTTHRLFEEPELTAILDQLGAAKRRYVHQATQMAMAANEYHQASWNLAAVLDDDFQYANVDAESIRLMRQAAKGRGVQKEGEREKFQSYAYNGDGGNCVFSSQPFGAAGAANAGQSYYQSGIGKTHMRCYSETDLNRYSGDGGEFRVMMKINEYTWWTQPAAKPGQYANGQRYVDVAFTVPEAPIDGDDFAFLDVELQFGEITEYVWDGDRQVPQWRYSRVAGSNFFWEKDPTAMK